MDARAIARTPMARAMALSVALHLALLLGTRYSPPEVPREQVIRVSLIEVREPTPKAPASKKVRTPTKRPPKVVKKRTAKRPSRQAKAAPVDPLKEMERHYQEALERIKKKAAEPEGNPSPGVFDLYLGLITERVRSFWTVPDGFVDWDAEAVIRLKIDPRGRILFAKVERPSGNPVFDRSVLQAVYKAEPFPPPPGGKEMEVGFVFRP